MPLLFQIFYLLVPKIEICLKYFLDKNSQKAAIVLCQGWWKRVCCSFFLQIIGIETQENTYRSRFCYLQFAHPDLSCFHRPWLCHINTKEKRYDLPTFFLIDLLDTADWKMWANFCHFCRYVKRFESTCNVRKCLVT